MNILDKNRVSWNYYILTCQVCSSTLPIAANTEQKPAEGKIAFGLQQPDGSIAYNYTANVGFWCSAEGKVDNWGDTAPVFFEYDKDNFVLSDGHRFGVSKAGTKYVVKPVLVYTKGGKLYKATITLNMQF